MPGAVVIGTGPGIGLSVSRRFAREGLPIALVARAKQTVDGVADALAPSGVRVVGLTADSTDETALRAALDAAADALGPPEVVVYNAAIIQRDSPGELPAHTTWTPGRSTWSGRSPPPRTSRPRWRGAGAGRSSSPAGCPSRIRGM